MSLVGAYKRIRALERLTEVQAQSLELLAARVVGLSAALETLRQPAADATEERAPAATVRPIAPVLTPPPGAAPTPAMAIPPKSTPKPLTTPPLQPPPAPVPIDERARVSPLPPAAARIDASQARASEIRQQHAAAGGAAGEPPSFSPPMPPDAAPQAPGFDWESLIGVKLFSWIAAVALPLAASSSCAIRSSTAGCSPRFAWRSASSSASGCSSPAS